MITHSIQERPIIGITGSAGKTTTRKMVVSILQQRFNLFETIDNLNTESSTPVYVNMINNSHTGIVLEFGINSFNSLRTNCNLIQPNISVITNVGTAHIGNFDGDIQQLALAKSELISGTNPNGLLFINNDYPSTQHLLTKQFSGKIISVGIENTTADYVANDVEFFGNGMTFRVSIDGNDQSFYIPIWGAHNVYNALFAIAISHQLQFTNTEIAAGLKNYQRPLHRLYPYQIGDITIIDDSYNASPQGVQAGLTVLSMVGDGDKIAILGSMRELGVYEEQGYEEVGRCVAEKNINYLYLFSENSKKIGEAAINHGFDKRKVIHCSTHKELRHKLMERLSKPATFLFKGYDKPQIFLTIKYLHNYLKWRCALTTRMDDFIKT